jgi:hypothetical protein
MQLFMAVPMTPSAFVSDFGGRRYHRFVPFNFLLFLAAPHLHSVLVLVTGNKFIVGVVVTGIMFTGVVVTGNKFVAGVVVTGEKLIIGINDTGDH